MYVPSAFAWDDRVDVLAMLRNVAFGHLVTPASAAGGGFSSTALPFVVDDDLTALRAHVARGNDQWRSIDGASALVIVPGTDAYVSPRWYPSKAVDGRVVPTWNYELVHLHGTVRVHDDPAWTRTIVGDLTELLEERVSSHDGAGPWAVTDAPPDFIERQLRAIVGVEVVIERVDAKRKLGQNRSADDRLGVAEGLAGSPHRADQATATRMTS